MEDLDVEMEEQKQPDTIKGPLFHLFNGKLNREV